MATKLHQIVVERGSSAKAKLLGYCREEPSEVLAYVLNNYGLFAYKSLWLSNFSVQHTERGRVYQLGLGINEVKQSMDDVTEIGGTLPKGMRARLYIDGTIGSLLQGVDEVVRVQGKYVQQMRSLAGVGLAAERLWWEVEDHLLKGVRETHLRPLRDQPVPNVGTSIRESGWLYCGEKATTKQWITLTEAQKQAPERYTALVEFACAQAGTHVDDILNRPLIVHLP